MQLVKQYHAISEKLADYYSQLAWQAMIAEVNLTPKPGLVDKHNTGAHKDMALTDFHLSANAIAKYFPRFLHAGAQYTSLSLDSVLMKIRPIGLECETAMFQATQGVNTHKGSIFSLGLVLTSIGRLIALQQPISPQAISQLVAGMCAGITDELKQSTYQPTAGHRLYEQYGLTGARGEAEGGYQLVIEHSLPYYLKQLAKDKPNDIALLDTLILLMSLNNDTNIVNRGGISGLAWIKQRATQLLNDGINTHDYLIKVKQFDNECIVQNVSPGGSADLLILTWFFARLANKNFNLKLNKNLNIINTGSN